MPAYCVFKCPVGNPNKKIRHLLLNDIQESILTIDNLDSFKSWFHVINDKNNIGFVSEQYRKWPL